MITLSVIKFSGCQCEMSVKFEKVTQTTIKNSFSFSKLFFDENNKTVVETVPSENSDFILSMTVSN